MPAVELVAEVRLVAPLGSVEVIAAPVDGRLPAVQQGEAIRHRVVAAIFQVQLVMARRVPGVEVEQRLHSLVRPQEVAQGCHGHVPQEPRGRVVGQARHQLPDDVLREEAVAGAHRRKPGHREAEVLGEGVQEHLLLQHALLDHLPVREDGYRLLPAGLIANYVKVLGQETVAVLVLQTVNRLLDAPLHVEDQLQPARHGHRAHAVRLLGGVAKRRRLAGGLTRGAQGGVEGAAERLVWREAELVGDAVQHAEQGPVAGAVQEEHVAPAWARRGEHRLAARPHRAHRAREAPFQLDCGDVVVVSRHEPQSTADAMDAQGVVGDVEFMHVRVVVQGVLDDQERLMIDAVHGDVELHEARLPGEALQEEGHGRVLALLQRRRAVGELQALQDAALRERLAQAEESVRAETIPTHVQVPEARAAQQLADALLRHVRRGHAGVCQVDRLEALVPADGLAELHLQPGVQRHVAEVQRAQVARPAQQAHHALDGAHARAQAAREQQALQRVHRGPARQPLQEGHEAGVGEQGVAAQVGHLDDCRVVQHPRHGYQLLVHHVPAVRLELLRMAGDERQWHGDALQGVALLQVSLLVAAEFRQLGHLVTLCRATPHVPERLREGLRGAVLVGPAVQVRQRARLSGLLAARQGRGQAAPVARLPPHVQGRGALRRPGESLARWAAGLRRACCLAALLAAWRPRLARGALRRLGLDGPCRYRCRGGARGGWRGVAQPGRARPAGPRGPALVVGGGQGASAHGGAPRLDASDLREHLEVQGPLLLAVEVGKEFFQTRLALPHVLSHVHRLVVEQIVPQDEVVDVCSQARLLLLPLADLQGPGAHHGERGSAASFPFDFHALPDPGLLGLLRHGGHNVRRQLLDRDVLASILEALPVVQRHGVE
mmetsp:Transcript_97303/g.275297  ORF Transcript_97303/g.275297 Transcript_97303/m.275297 type:complete len:891 (-) Transcript_97303:988-3660(-)